MRAGVVCGAGLFLAASACGGASFEPRPGDATPADAGASAIEAGRAPTITALARLAVPAFAIALDAENVYWTLGLYTPPAGAAPWPIVMHCPKSGCQAPTVLAYATGIGVPGPNDDYAPRFIAVDRTSVFWSSSTESAMTVATCAIDGCSDAPATVLSTDALWGLGVTGGETVWVDDVVSACKPADCHATTHVLAASGEPMTMKVDGDQVYWADAQALRTCPVSGCVQPTVVVGVPEVSVFAVDATNVYWRAEAGLMMCAKHGCTSPRLLVPNDECGGGFVDMVADGVHVFWIAGNEVLECAVAGCGGKPTRIDTPYWDETDRPNRLAVDDESLYWTTGALYTGSSGAKWLHAKGTIMKRTPK